MFMICQKTWVDISNLYSNIIQLSKLICTSNHIMLHKYLLEESYALKCKRRFECDIADGIADSIHSLFLHL